MRKFDLHKKFGVIWPTWISDNGDARKA